MNILLILIALQVTDGGGVAATGLLDSNKKVDSNKNVNSISPTTQQHTVRKPVIGKPITAAASLKILGVEQNIVAKTNAQRIRNGKSPLKLDESLMRSARQHCTWMARNRSLQHTRAAVAENIAMGQSSSSEAVQDWMNSPGHRANMLSGQYTRIGVAAYRARDGQIYWCQQFTQ